MMDERIAYGFRCSWWGPIQEVGSKPNGLPCCPRCEGMLLEVSSAQVWWDGVDDQVSFGDTEYRAFIEWLQGKCYPNLMKARETFNRRTS